MIWFDLTWATSDDRGLWNGNHSDLPTPSAASSYCKFSPQRVAARNCCWAFSIRFPSWKIMHSAEVCLVEVCFYMLELDEMNSIEGWHFGLGHQARL